MTNSQPLWQAYTEMISGLKKCSKTGLLLNNEWLNEMEHGVQMSIIDGNIFKTFSVFIG